MDRRKQFSFISTLVMTWVFSNDSGRQLPHLKEHRTEEDVVELGAVNILQVRNSCQQNLPFGHNYPFPTLSSQLNSLNMLQTEVLFKLMFSTIRYALKIRREKMFPYCLQSLCTSLVNSLIPELGPSETEALSGTGLQRKSRERLHAITLFL